MPVGRAHSVIAGAPFDGAHAGARFPLAVA